MEQLEKTNNVRYLRQKYLDPMTGKADWRLIHVGEAKTTVKGFFGQPLMGLATSGVGGAGGTGAVTASAGMGGAAGTGGIGPTSTLGGSSAGGIGSTSGSGSSTLGAGSPTVGSGGAAGASGTTTTGTTGTGNGLGLTQSSGMPSGGAPIMGFGLPVEGDSIIVLNEQASYPKWEFIYDPRIEQLKKNSSLFGGASAANSSGTGALTPSAGMGGAGSAGTSSGGMNTGGFGSTGSGTTGSGSTGSGPAGSGSTPTPTPAPQQ